MLSGSAAIGESVWSGIKGVVTQPVKDARKKGVVGVFTVLICILCDTIGNPQGCCWLGDQTYHWCV